MGNYFSQITVYDPSSGQMKVMNIRDNEARELIATLQALQGIVYTGKVLTIVQSDASGRAPSDSDIQDAINHNPANLVDGMQISGGKYGDTSHPLLVVGSQDNYKVLGVRFDSPQHPNTMSDAEYEEYAKTNLGLDGIVKLGNLFLNTKTVSGTERQLEFVVRVETTSNGRIVTFDEFGSTGSLKGLAFKDSATVTGTAAAHSHSYQKAKISTALALQQGTVSSSGSFTPAGTNASSSVTGSATVKPKGTNAASAVSLTGGSTSKLVTTQITGTNGTESVSKVTKTASKLVTTTITGTNGTESVSKVTRTASKLVTGTVKQVAAADRTQLCKVSVDGETLVLTPVSFEDVTVATGGVASNGAGSDIVTAVSISDKTVAKAASAATTVATGAVASTGTGSDIVTGVTIADKTVAKAGSAVTVATGSVDSAGAGATVATALPTGGTAAAQTFTGTEENVEVSGTAAAQKFTGTAGNVSVSGTSNTTIKTNIALGYDTVESGTKSAEVNGTAS